MLLKSKKLKRKRYNSALNKVKLTFLSDFFLFKLFGHFYICVLPKILTRMIFALLIQCSTKEHFYQKEGNFIPRRF